MAGESPEDLTYVGETANKFLSYFDTDTVPESRLEIICNFAMPSLGPAHNSLVGKHIRYEGLDVATVLPDFATSPDDKLSQLFIAYDHYYFGFQAANRFMRHIHHGLLQVRPDTKYDETTALFRGLVRFYQESTFIAPSAWSEGTRESKLDLRAKRLDQCAEGIRRLIHAGNAPGYRKHEGWVDPFSDKIPEITKFLNIQKGAFSVYKKRDLLIFASNEGKGVSRELLVLSFKDQSKLLFQLEATSKWIEYGKGLASTYGFSEDICSDMLNWLMGCIDRCPTSHINELCKMVKVVHTWVVATFMGHLSAAIALKHRTTLQVGVWATILDSEKICMDLLKLPSIAMLGLSQVYRIFATPDIDERKSINDLKERHLNPRSLPSDPESAAMRAMVWNYVDRQLMVSVRKWAGVYPGKPRFPDDEDNPEWVKRAMRGEKSDIPLDFQDYWSIDGAMPYAGRDDTYYELVKDKACCYDQIESVSSGKEYAKLPLTEVNSLIKLLKSPNPIKLDEVKQEVDTGRTHTTVKIGIRSERHKPYGRPFFIQKEKYKLLLSELEENVDRVASRVPGYGISQGGIKFLDKVRKMSSIDAKAIKHRMFCLSFDLDLFSPRMAPETRDRMYKRWSRLFGQGWIANMSKASANVGVRFMNFRSDITYHSIGNDFEGMNAKQNTEFHPAVMATCIRWLRESERKLAGTLPPAIFDSFIDDGALVILFPDSHYDYLKDKFLAIIDKVYKSVGWEISWDKTFLSDHGFVYLNRIFSGGKEVQTGIKSFIKVAVVHENSTESIVDRLDTLKGRFQGAIEAGAPVMHTYWIYFKEFVKEIRRWDRELPLDNTRVLPLLIAPISFGGFGLSSLFSATTNVGESSVAQGVDFLYSTKMESLLEEANKIMQKPVKEKRAIDVFRNPKTVTLDTAHLVSARMMSEAQKVVLNVMENPLLKDMYNAVDYGKADDMLSSLLAETSGTIALPLLEKIWNSMPEKYLEDFLSKFRRSRSIVELLGRDVVSRIRTQNKNDVRKLITAHVLKQ